MPVDELRLSFDSNGLLVINVALAFIMYGVALDLSLADFGRLARDPRAPAVGLVSQFLILPALALPLALFVAPVPSMALGMILVAACPGGNISNVITQLARGRVSVSVGMTAISTLAAMFTTPFNLTFWGSLHPSTAALLEEVSVDPLDMAFNVAMLLAVPCALGMLTAHHAPRAAAAMRRPARTLSVAFFALVVVAAFASNWEVFLVAIGTVALPVALLNGLALGIGWLASGLAGLPTADRRAVTVEVGIQNSGLGLVLVFNFFEGLGGMAIVAGWWGIWHIIAGLSLAAYWSWRDRQTRSAA